MKEDVIDEVLRLAAQLDDGDIEALIDRLEELEPPVSGVPVKSDQPNPGLRAPP